MTVQVALSDVVSPEDGPTQYVVGSHLSGREPPTREPPDIDPELEFAGNGTASVFCRAGDIYLCARNNARMLGCWVPELQLTGPSVAGKAPPAVVASGQWRPVGPVPLPSATAVRRPSVLCGVQRWLAGRVPARGCRRRGV